MDRRPKPVMSPLRVGTIQCTDGLYPAQPNQNRPHENEMPPMMTSGSRHSGIGIPPLAASFLL